MALNLTPYNPNATPAPTPLPKTSGGFNPVPYNPNGFPTKVPDKVHKDFLQKITDGLFNQNEQKQIGDAALGGIQQTKEAFKQAGNAKNILQLFESSAKMGAGIVNTAFSPLAPVFKPVSDAVNYVGDKISDNPTVQKFAESKPGKVTSRVAEDVGNLDTIAGAVAGSKAAMGIKEPVVAVANKVMNKINPPEGTPPPPLNEAKVIDQYNRAIRPTVAGKNTAGQVAASSSKVLSGIQTIADNAPNLTLTDHHGEITTGQLPKSVDQFSQAIQQTKASIFEKYDALAKQAGEKGVVIDTPNIAAELEPIINSKSLAIANPRAIDYATQLQKRLIETGGIDAQTAQDVIQHYNEALKAFYQNPNYETASTASIDALVANKFREQLDSEITNATGEKYQTLKNQYGALASMEKDVTHRNIVWGRQNAVGLASNLANITSGAELVRGLIRLNPADLAASVAIKGIQKWIQYLNNPDVGVSRIFSQVKKSSPPAIETKIPPVK